MKKRWNAVFISLLVILLLASCDSTPDGNYLKKVLASDSRFYALFDSHVGKDT